ncbi:serine/threonine-protein kinase [Nonomuraea sediminis]|uniref:serine/threonine-protein kinase n=1 Tax=Nonomuraea sediminis TaxID=2835864 RepID=UPI00202A27BF|nr:serine/threonine-protein kinase [Nonomuraea sediminis]
MTRCAQPGCTGTIEDGYCDLCGAAAPAQQAGSPPPIQTGQVLPGPAAPDTAPVSRGMSTPLSRQMTGPTSSGRSRAGVLGDALDDLPPIPYRDPSTAVLANPEVPEDKRFCANPACGKPVGRSRSGRPGLPEGFCPHCRTQFSFTPKLGKGDLVAAQYRVLGCLAHGGLGWIYLAADENLDGRWVVLKGLLNTADAEALAAAEAERRFLTTVDHPNIVKIFNFQRSAGLGYIVMEYVGGQSLHELRRQGPIPLRETLMYGREILRAFSYLHEQGVVYCDLKPANVIRVGKRLKLIDLGAVQRIGSPPGTSWATVGYHAPELDTQPSSVASDLYTVARTLAVLAIQNFSPAKSGQATPLPQDCGNESFARLLRRATAHDPNLRFASAVDMEDQLVGVLREVSAIADGVPYPAPSRLFGPERLAAGASLSQDTGRVFDPLDPLAAARALPVPLMDPLDPATGALAGLVGRDPVQLIAQVSGMQQTPEAMLTKIRLMAEQGGDHTAATLQELDQAERAIGGDWRLTWYRGVHALTSGNAGQAVQYFDACFSMLPGELAPKLALAFALECAGQDPSPWYTSVWRTDRSYVSAAFGLARTGRVTVLDEVPSSSSHRVAADMALVASIARHHAVDRVKPEQLTDAAERLDDLVEVAPRRRESLTAELLEAALRWLAAGNRPPGSMSLAGAPLTDAGMRRQLEATLRRLASSADTRQEKHVLVNRANAIRPRTWI